MLREWNPQWTRVKIRPRPITTIDFGQQGFWSLRISTTLTKTSIVQVFQTMAPSEHDRHLNLARIPHHYHCHPHRCPERLAWGHPRIWHPAAGRVRQWPVSGEKPPGLTNSMIRSNKKGLAGLVAMVYCDFWSCFPGGIFLLCFWY
jgi:hypothetical protein